MDIVGLSTRPVTSWIGLLTQFEHVFGSASRLLFSPRGTELPVQVAHNSVAAKVEQ
jgi:hypothetical protein